MRTQTAKLTVLVSVLLVVGVAVLASIGVTRDPSRYNFDALIERLDSGTVTAGSQPPLDAGKPISEVRYDAPDGAVFVLATYSHDHKVLNLYTRDRIVFAAQLVEGVRRSRETWYFCDTDLLVEHVQLSMKRSD